MTAKDEYEVFCDGVHRLAGIDLSSYKRGQMERRIRSFAEHQGARSLDAYIDLLKRSPESLDRFLDRMTINVSELYRNPEQYERLSRSVLPELAASGRVRIWSAGASYGAEAYTLACLANEVMPGVRTEIVGTDIDRRMIARAQRGHFSAEDARSVPPKVLSRWFTPKDGGYQAAEELRRLCRFRQGDLLRDRYETGFDLVLCRNVVIYFTEAVRNQVHEGLARSVRPGGYLMVGSTERIATPGQLGLELAHPFIYRKVA